MSLPAVVAVVGTNASGKSELGIHLAHHFSGEVVSADSRQIYRSLNIGTGKLAPAEHLGVPHHLLDIVDVGQPFSLADYQREAYRVIHEILARHHLPIVVGGTGLYVRAVVDGYELIGVPPDPALRSTLDTQTTEQLVATLRAINPEVAARIDLRNRRRIIRALEICYTRPDAAAVLPSRPQFVTWQLGVTWDRGVLYERIDRRLDRRIEMGLIDEVRGLVSSGIPLDVIDALGLEYRFVLRYLVGQYRTESEMRENLKRAIHDYARRQITWFKKDSRIVWLDTRGDYYREARALTADFLESRRRPGPAQH